MYAGINSTSNTSGNITTIENDNASEIPEWKKMLIMKKRAGIVGDEHTRRNADSLPNNVNITHNGDSNYTCDNFPSGNKFTRSAKVVEQDFREISPPKTVTIGNINVELRSVKSSDNADSSLDSSKMDKTSNSDLNTTELEDDGCEDLQYGPGIVDRLRARFLNLGAKKQRTPVVRRFSSLENLPGSNAGPYRVNARGIRQNGFKVGSGNYYGCGNVKKAQSMETLICSTPEQQIFSISRRPNNRYVGGVKARILAKNISPITMFTDENDEPSEKSPSPASSPRLFTKSARRWDYSRPATASSINEDELPKPDTVKHVKKIFEASVNVNSSEKSSSHSVGVRFRKIPGTVTTPTSVSNNGAILGSARPLVKKLDVVEDNNPDAKSSAKESPDLSLDIPPQNEDLLSPTQDAENNDDSKINKRGHSPVLDDNLSANRSCDTPLTQAYTESLSSDAFNLLDSPENTDTKTEAIPNLISPIELPIKVTPEQLPLEDYKHSEVLSQGTQVIPTSSGAELRRDEDLSLPHPQPGVVNPEEGMVVAAAATSDSFQTPKTGVKWQKAPSATTSIVFDFRGKDVKPNISLSPTPFGCRPAKVTKNTNAQKKRSGSPLRSGVNGLGATCRDYELEDEPDTGEDEDEEDWDEMDIGADLPAVSGIVFSGENVKIGRGAFLETRNKKLTIQFDDKATSTFEYPSENASPSPMEENGSSNSLDSSFTIDSSANSRFGLSNYTPQVLSSNSSFELGVSQLNHRSSFSPSDKNDDDDDDVPTLGAIVPAKPEDTSGWSATESADILF